jgi:hypothetical protein
VAVAGADRVPVDALGGDALAAPALDGVVEAEDHRPARREGVEQQPEQHARRRAPAPGGAVEDAVVVHEAPLLREPADAQEAGHGAPAGSEDRADQQYLGMPPNPRPKERREAPDQRHGASRHPQHDARPRVRTPQPGSAPPDPPPPAGRPMAKLELSSTLANSRKKACKVNGLA